MSDKILRLIPHYRWPHYRWNGPGWYGYRYDNTADKIPYGNADDLNGAKGWASYYGFSEVIGWFDTEEDLEAVTKGVAK
jgi:hypothetical protein